MFSSFNQKFTCRTHTHTYTGIPAHRHATHTWSVPMRSRVLTTDAPTYRVNTVGMEETRSTITVRSRQPQAVLIVRNPSSGAILLERNLVLVCTRQNLWRIRSPHGWVLEGGCVGSSISPHFTSIDTETRRWVGGNTYITYEYIAHLPPYIPSAWGFRGLIYLLFFSSSTI